jgi:hypothetical protein
VTSINPIAAQALPSHDWDQHACQVVRRTRAKARLCQQTARRRNRRLTPEQYRRIGSRESRNSAGPKEEDPGRPHRNSVRSNIATTVVAPTTAIRMPGTRLRSCRSRITTRVPIPTAPAKGLQPRRPTISLRHVPLILTFSRRECPPSTAPLNRRGDASAIADCGCFRFRKLEECRTRSTPKIIDQIWLAHGSRAR